MKNPFTFVFFLLVLGCTTNNNPDVLEKGDSSIEEIKDTRSEKNKNFILNELPKSKPPLQLNDRPCHRVYENQSVELSSDLKQLGFLYDSYIFDTLINTTRLFYSYKIVGTKDRLGNNPRLLSSLQKHFEDMANAIDRSGLNFNCLYAQLTDSIEIQSEQLLYTRNEVVTLGGAGSMKSSKKYTLTPIELRINLNNTADAGSTDSLEKYRTSVRYY